MLYKLRTSVSLKKSVESLRLQRDEVPGAMTFCNGKQHTRLSETLLYSCINIWSANPVAASLSKYRPLRQTAPSASQASVLAKKQRWGRSTPFTFHLFFRSQREKPENSPLLIPPTRACTKGWRATARASLYRLCLASRVFHSSLICLKNMIHKTLNHPHTHNHEHLHPVITHCSLSEVNMLFFYFPPTENPLACNSEQKAESRRWKRGIFKSEVFVKVKIITALGSGRNLHLSQKLEIITNYRLTMWRLGWLYKRSEF